MAQINIDENRWPIVIITLSGNETRQDIQHFLERLEQFQSRDEDFCFVMDLREMHRLPQEARNRLVTWLMEADLHQLAGTAVVVSSPLMKLYLSSVIWMAKSLDRRKRGFKHKTARSLSEAYEWSRSRLGKSRAGGSGKTKG
jgi:hypothetical protein